MMPIRTSDGAEAAVLDRMGITREPLGGDEQIYRRYTLRNATTAL
jgi:hypothetical protein